MSELPPGQVTIADLYRELVAMRRDVGKALTRLEVIDTRNTETERQQGDHESRIRLLEAFKFKLTGIALAVGVVSGLLSGYLTVILQHH